MTDLFHRCSQGGVRGRDEEEMCSPPGTHTQSPRREGKEPTAQKPSQLPPHLAAGMIWSNAFSLPLTELIN